jgi:hypothetical protein
MFRSTTIVRELTLHLAKVICQKHSVKLCRYIYAVVWLHDSKTKMCIREENTFNYKAPYKITKCLQIQKYDLLETLPTNINMLTQYIFH